MKILVTGGTGFIGKALVKTLIGRGHQVAVLSRTPKSVEQQCGPEAIALGHLSLLAPEMPIDVIINLAGAPIFDVRWTEARKQLIRASRIGLTEQLNDCIERMADKPKLLISGSAIGYYGDQGDAELTEESPVRPDFSQQLCADWEAAATRASTFGVRVCLIRTGLVIAEGGGLLQRMLLPFRLGFGGRLGNGRQWMSWIHRQDWINIVLTMIADESMQGAYNATAPNPVTNQEFTCTLARHLHRPALFPAPAFALKLLLGEMSELVLGSQRVLPTRLLKHGFKFQYPDLDGALRAALAAKVG
ncbi:TIGR01777 family oxidoreductase [Methylomicrobium sp. Wu6]|uniref:TIGR01777 family oxidoreductase n=1 Tax=Methylomicrobium sp. Wu6 TaxID=3107928 RepID=UPI002DD673B1|nr:TIGR01777 family oxidoreductase [Methylomicrobium sp. Wu6]MEC4750251.1 TIGR01777 family oxidoreductase [Methylomicrobium sp. Wu6]